MYAGSNYSYFTYTGSCYSYCRTLLQLKQLVMLHHSHLFLSNSFVAGVARGNSVLLLVSFPVDLSFKFDHDHCERGYSCAES